VDLGLKDKRALVTGSTSGIGEAVAKRLAAEGARVIVHGRDKERAETVAAAIRAEGGEAIYALADLTTHAGCDALADRIKGALGGLDILVNNAGSSENPSRTWATVEWEHWLADLEINAGSAFRMIQHFLPGMKEQGWGRIVQFASTSGTMPGAETTPAYGPVKAAIISMTTSLSSTVARYGVTVNCVTPGGVDTPVLRRFLTKMPVFEGKSFEEIERVWVKNSKVPAGRIGVPDDLAPAVAFLCSREADWITGINLRIDGGLSYFINT
jgi:NAD(P)-dependent dehydrogenase (short-subunit alcohol dehydrogenase family)